MSWFNRIFSKKQPVPLTVDELIYREMVERYYVGKLTQKGKAILEGSQLATHFVGLGSLHVYTNGKQRIEFLEAIGDGCTIPSSWDVTIKSI